MFQYTHELVFNSLTMPDGSQRVLQNKGTGPLIIKRGGEYWKSFIQDQKVYKTPGYAGVYELLKIDASVLATIFPGTNGATMTPGVYQLSMFVKLLDPHAIYELGYPNYNTFGRHILIGFEVAATDDEAAIAKKIYDGLSLAVNKDELLVGGLDESGDTPAIGEFQEDAQVVAVRVNHYALRFEAVGVALYDETTCDSCIGEYLNPVDILNNENDANNAAEIVVEGKEPFATGEWLIENLRFPSYPNVRYWAVNGGDYPAPGLTYVQFSFAYDSPRPQLGGVSGVGQKMAAVTRHIYYVPESVADAFEDAFDTLGVTVVETMPEIIDPDGNSVSGGASGGSEGSEATS